LTVECWHFGCASLSELHAANNLLQP
jgi:hypothetical protein